MGLIVDTNVFIRFEKSGQAVDLSTWDNSERVYISAISASELLVGVNRANTEKRRQQRSTFVEAVIKRVGVLVFDISVARVHASLFATLSAMGQQIGAHDPIIAATAICHDHNLLTDNVHEHSRVPGLRVIPFVS